MSSRLLVPLVIAATTLMLGACGGGDADSPSSQSAQDASAELPLTHHPDTTGAEWQPLFGPNLSGAMLERPDSWKREDGVLAATDHTTIWADTSYGNFVLDFEARVPDGSNSGVFFRTANPDDILSAIELQMLDPPGPNGEADPRHQYGGRNGMAALYDLKGASGGTPKPSGEWNRLTIVARDSMIYVVLNGTQIHKMNLNDWTEPGRTPSGQKHKFDRALANQARSGPIGLQGIHSENGKSVEYRNLKVRRLEP